MDPSQVFAAGATLAQLHQTLARYTNAGRMMAAGDDPAWPRRLAKGDLQGSLPGRVDALQIAAIAALVVGPVVVVGGLMTDCGGGSHSPDLLPEAL